MDREAWQAIVLGITKSWIQLSTHIIFHTILIEILCGREYYLSFEDEEKCTNLHNLYMEEPELVPSLNSREHILSLHLLNGHYSSIHLSAHSIICIFLNQLLSIECVLNTIVGIQFS